MATFNGAHTLPVVLDAYSRLSPPTQGWRLLLIDNGSSDGSAALAGQFAGRLPLQCICEARRGKNAALNTGVALALKDGATELLVFSDDDAIPAPDWLLQLERAALAQPGFSIFGGHIVPEWGGAPPEWIPRLVPLGLTYAATDPALADGPVFAGLVWGANMAIRRRVFDAGARFDDTLGPNGAAYAMGSETEFNRRLAEAGERSWFCAGARVRHLIRPWQLSRAYILERAWRYGRGQYRQERPDDCPRLLGVPRWMVARALQELVRLAGAALRRDADRVFVHRWELARLGGYLHEAWRGQRSRARTVLITSYSGELGGMELRMAQEARYLRQAGYRGVLATRAFPGFVRWAHGLRAEGIAISRYEPPLFFEQWEWRRWNLLRTRMLGRRALLAYGADLVHIAFCWTNYGASTLWLAQHCGLPVVVSVHNAFPQTTFSQWHQPLLRQAFRSVRGVYAVSASALQHFLALFQSYLGDTVRYAVIPNSVDIERFRCDRALRAPARARLGLPEDCLAIGSVARLSEQKRPEALIRLLQALLPRFPQLYLVLIGTGPLEADLRAQAQHSGVAGRVLFAGFQDAVEQLLPALDVHVLLSRNEGFGIATIEAMACGVPVVCSDVPGSRDILQHSAGGLLVPAEDDGAIAAAVADLLNSPLRRLRMGQAARAEVAAQYASAIVGEQVRSFYRGLL
ncbi:glycosyltransferase [Oxalobacteraceae bacterium]|nr:glycosyltransferase [Oxalobacteraceae bacterium]